MRGELSRVRECVPQLVQAELDRWLAERSRAAHVTLEGLAADVSAANLESLRAELDLLDQAELRTLQDTGAPLRDKLELVDWIRQRRSRIQAQIREMKTGGTGRWGVAHQSLAEWLGGDSIGGAGPQRRWRFGGVVPTLLGLLLVAVVGLVGILLPRRAEPTAGFLVELATLYQATGQGEVAIELLDTAEEAGLRDADVLGTVGQGYLDLKAYEKAVAVLERAGRKPWRVELQDGLVTWLRQAKARSVGVA